MLVAIHSPINHAFNDYFGVICFHPFWGPYLFYPHLDTLFGVADIRAYERYKSNGKSVAFCNNEYFINVANGEIPAACLQDPFILKAWYTFLAFFPKETLKNNILASPSTEEWFMQPTADGYIFYEPVYTSNGSIFCEPDGNAKFNTKFEVLIKDK